MRWEFRVESWKTALPRILQSSRQQDMHKSPRPICPNAHDQEKCDAWNLRSRHFLGPSSSHPWWREGSTCQLRCLYKLQFSEFSEFKMSIGEHSCLVILADCALLRYNVLYFHLALGPMKCKWTSLEHYNYSSCTSHRWPPTTRTRHPCPKLQHTSISFLGVQHSAIRRWHDDVPNVRPLKLQWPSKILERNRMNESCPCYQPAPALCCSSCCFSCPYSYCFRCYPHRPEHSTAPTASKMLKRFQAVNSFRDL